jgi:hypothetical protein
MSDARKVLREIGEQRARTEAEAQRWAGYRRRCGPPRWFLLLLVALGSASVVLVLESLNSAANKQALAGLGRIGLVIYAVIWPLLLVYVEGRRRSGLKQILAQEAPELAAKLKDERIL